LNRLVFCKYRDADEGAEKGEGNTVEALRVQKCVKKGSRKEWIMTTPVFLPNPQPLASSLL
jgi:hypothetical protein